jgi:hypothetical protein
VYPSEASKVSGSSRCKFHECSPLSFLADQPSLHTTSAAHHEQNEYESSLFPTNDCFTTVNDNTTLDEAYAPYSTTKVSSHDLHHIDSSYFECTCDKMLPIEHDSDFMNIGALLKLGKELNSVVTSDDDDIHASPANGDDQWGPAFFSGF